MHVEQETDPGIHKHGVIHNTRCSKDPGDAAEETR